MPIPLPEDPRILAAAGVAALLLLLLLVRVSRRRAAARRAADPVRALGSVLLRLEEDVVREKAAFGAVAASIEGESSSHAQVIGHARAMRRHRFRTTLPDAARLQDSARKVGIRSDTFVELGDALRKARSTFDAWNEGRFDADRTPIATAVGIRKDLERLGLLASLARRNVPPR
jgi:hypothetical protein